MKHLIERLEKASGPDRELDGEIWKAVVEQPGDVWEKHLIDGEVWMRQDPDDRCAYDTPPHYTSSLDAAMTLVPEGYSIKMYAHPDENHVEVYALGEYHDGKRLLLRGPYEAEQIKTLALALALTIAALKAREGTR